jgi:predicted outer membrane repeat protein
VISNAKTAREFTAAATCTNGKLTADWRVSLTLDEPIAVGQGTQLVVNGISEEETVISGDGTTLLFTVQTGAALELDSLTLSRGFISTPGGGAVFLAEASLLKASRVRFIHNSSGEVGGAVLAQSQSVVSFDNCVFTNNTAGEGGACFLTDTSTVVTSTVFSNNTAQRTTAGAILQNGGSLVLTDSELLDNSAAVVGGAIHLSSDTGEGSLTVSGSRFIGNAAVAGGGAVVNSNGRSTLLNCSISSNAALAITGASTNTIAAPGCGGAVLSVLGTAVITSCNFPENTAAARGGSLYSIAGTLNATDCSFDRNSAADAGGAVAIPYYDPLAAPPARRLLAVADAVTVLQLQQLRQLRRQQSQTVLLHLTRCTFAGNTAATGGALYTGENSLIDSCEFNDNSASVSGGADYYATGSDDTPTGSFAE